MVNGLLQRNRLAANVLIVLFGLFLWIDTAGAALLKDIRVGEHKTFTRVVFELDRDVASRQIIPGKAGRLTVLFTDTRPDLVRKIPIEPAPSIDGLRIFTAKNNLSVSLQFIRGHQRIVSKFIGHPPRLIVDVHLQSSPLASISGPLETHTMISPNGNDRQLPRFSEGLAEQPPSQTDAALAALPAELPQLQPLTSHPGEPVHPESSAASSTLSGESPGDKGEPSLPSPIIDPYVQITDQPAQQGSTGSSIARPSRFQYVLVVALITIILVMLILLGAIMLSLHRKWRDRREHLSTREVLKRQDDRIASLNARIQEQLERYEEA